MEYMQVASLLEQLFQWQEAIVKFVLILLLIYFDSMPVYLHWYHEQRHLLEHFMLQESAGLSFLLVDIKYDLIVELNR